MLSARGSVRHTAADLLRDVLHLVQDSVRLGFREVGGHDLLHFLQIEMHHSQSTAKDPKKKKGLGAWKARRVQRLLPLTVESAGLAISMEPV